MEEAGEKPFECSEMFIFGKFETFKKRVEQIVYVLNTTIKYSILQSSTIEGIDVYANKFIEFHKKISTQKYDALNHRLPYFDADYKEFKKHVIETEWELEEFVGTSLEKMTDVDNVLRLLKRYVILIFHSYIPGVLTMWAEDRERTDLATETIFRTQIIVN